MNKNLGMRWGTEGKIWEKLLLLSHFSFSTPQTVAHQASCPLISQARILEWVAISFSRRSFRPRNQTCISYIGRWVLYHWATWERRRESAQVTRWPLEPTENPEGRRAPLSGSRPFKGTKPWKWYSILGCLYCWDINICHCHKSYKHLL